MINDILGTFFCFSEKKVNKNKSQMFFSPNVSVGSVNDICSIVGFEHVKNLGMYLGMPFVPWKSWEVDI